MAWSLQLGAHSTHSERRTHPTGTPLSSTLCVVIFSVGLYTFSIWFSFPRNSSVCSGFAHSKVVTLHVLPISSALCRLTALWASVVPSLVILMAGTRIENV